MESISKNTFLRVGYNFDSAPPFVVELFESNLTLSSGTQSELGRFHSILEALAFCEKYITDEEKEITGGIRIHPSVYATVAMLPDASTEDNP